MPGVYQKQPRSTFGSKKIVDAMALESQRPDTRVPNGSTRLRTLFSNGMITMKKLESVRRLGCSEANHECDDRDGWPQDERSRMSGDGEAPAAGSCSDGEDGGGGGDRRDGGGGGGPSACCAGGGGEADGGAGGRCRRRALPHAAAAREEADGAPQTADGARGLSGACAAGIPVGAGASPNDVSDASPGGGGGAVGGAGWKRGAEGDGGPLCEDSSNSGSDLSCEEEKEERDMGAHSRKDPALRALLEAAINEDHKAARNRQPANAIDSVKSSFLQRRKAAPAPADGDSLGAGGGVAFAAAATTSSAVIMCCAGAAAAATTAAAAAAREEADGAPRSADGARGLSGACAAGVGASASPNDVSNAAPGTVVNAAPAPADGDSLGAGGGVGFAAATSTSSAVIMSCAGAGGGDGRVSYLEYTTACCRNDEATEGAGPFIRRLFPAYFEFESEVKSVPKDGSCWAHAVLRTVRELYIDKLEQALPLSNPSLSWMTLIADLNKWQNFGDESIKSNTTIRFTEHVTRQLLDAQNEAKCHQFITGQPSDGDLGDMPVPAAIARAAELGLLYDVKNPVHKWAIAMLHPKTQFSDPVMRAILKLDFDGMLGVVTLSRI